MARTISLNGNTSVIEENFFPPIELKRDYECALIDFYMYNSIPNVDENNNLFHIDDKTIKIPIGSYELDDIVNIIYSEMKKQSIENTLTIKSNSNTLQVEITTAKFPIYFNKKNSIGGLFGFSKNTVLSPNSNHTYISELPVNIMKINTIRIECNIISGSYVNNTPSHSLYEFGMNVPPGYKMNVLPHNLIYLPINTKEISTIKIQITDQNGELLNLRGENITIHIHLRPIQ